MSIKLFRYKLATIDSVCNDTAWSTPHMTMHLQTFDTKTPGVVGLRWNAYEGLDIRSYVVYKYTSDNVEHILDTLANNNDEISFNDTTSPSDNVRYRVSMLLPARVDLEEFLKSDGGPYSLSLSNMAESKILSVYQPGYDSVKIYPVPVSERLVVELPSRPLLIQLVTVTGTVLYQETTPASRVSIDMSGLVPGAYFVRIHTHNAIITRPISK
jgi:hypothetical protein